MERKEQERKKSQKVDFVAGGTQTATVVPSLNINTQNSGTNQRLHPKEWKMTFFGDFCFVFALI